MADPITLTGLLVGAVCGIPGGVLANRADSLVCRFGREFVATLTEVGVPRNHDALRAMRRAQLDALGSLAQALRAGKAVITPADMFDCEIFLPRIDKFLQQEEAAAKRLALTNDLAKALSASVDATLAAPSSGTGKARLESFAIKAASCVWDEIGPLNPPPAFRVLFDGHEPGVPSWFEAYGVFLGQALKKDADFRAIFTADRLANILSESVDLREAVDDFVADSEKRHNELTVALARIADTIKNTALSIKEIVEESNRAWHGVRLETGRAEPANERIQIRPTELLLPRYRVAPFVDRDGLLSSILSWVTQPSERRATGRLYVAPGGFGKTRLGIELLIELEALGWRCGFISKAHGGFLTPGALLDLMAAAGAVGVCVVVDYAESLIRELGELSDSALASGSAGPPIRVVAFARSPEGWWASFAGDASPSAVFDPTPFSAISEQLSAQDRSEIFAQSRAAFVDKFRAVGLPYQEQGQPPNLAAADRPLLVVAIAFLDAIGVDSRGRSVFQTLYEEERRQWRRVLQVEADDEVADLARAVAQVTLVQGTTADGAAALMHADDTDRSIPRPKILTSLRRLYGVRAIQDNPATPEGEDIPFISPLEPDLLGEHACIEVLQESDPALLSSTLNETLIGPPFFRDDAERILAVLVRSTHPNHDPRIRRGAQRAIAHLSTLVPELAAFQVGHLANSLPPRSVALSEFALVVARRLVAVAPQDASEAALKQRADTQAYLSARLSDRGDHEGALAAGKEAVKLHRQLAAMNREDSLLGLASALHLHSQNLIQLGRRRDAVAPSEEAVELYRELAETSPETPGPGLAESLRNLGETYSSVGRKDDALEASKDACARFEVLAGENPDRFLPALAGALNSLANRLFQAGQSEKALEATSKAVEIDRQLVAKNRDAYLPGLAAALNNLGRDLQNRNMADEALAVILEAMEYHRELVEKNRGGHLLGLALALQGASIVQFDLGQQEQALTSINDSIALLRELSAKSPDAIVPDLVFTLANFGRMLAALNRPAEACNIYEEGARLIRPFAVRFPGSFKGLFEHLRDRYLQLAIETPPEAFDAVSRPRNIKIQHPVPEGSTAFDEADRLLQMVIRGHAAVIAIQQGLAEEEEDTRLEHLHTGERAMAELADFLAENPTDETLEPIKKLATYLMRLVLPGGPSGEAEAAKVSELFFDVRRARVRAHPQDANARRALAEELMSNADDPVYGAERLQELHDLRKTHPDDAIVRQFDAWALHVESNNAAVRGDEAHHEVKLDELRYLSSQYMEDSAIAAPLAKSIKNNCQWAIGNKDIRQRESSLDELRELNSRCPESAAIRLQLAEALFLVLMDDVSSSGVGPDESGAPRPLLVELWDLVKNHPEDSELMEFFRSRFHIYEADGSGERLDPTSLI